MLNELCQLSDALEKAGITPKDWHPQLKPLPNVSDKKSCYRISIAEDGAVSSVDTMSVDQVAILRKWEPNNGSSFPGFNIQSIYRITDNSQKKQIKMWREGKTSVDFELLKSWCTEENDNWDRKIATKLFKCLNEIPQELSKLAENSSVKLMPAMLQLVARVVKFSHANVSANKPHAKGFREVLENYLWEVIEHGDSIRTVLPMLIYEGSTDKKPENDQGAISVFLDIPDWKEYRVSSRESVEALNDCLVGASRSKETKPTAVDAYGVSIAGNGDKLPSVKLPLIADVKLRAMNSESFCQVRYGTIDAESFPVGQVSRKRAKGALEWLGDESREGETWGRADAKELLFAYPAVRPEVSVKLASCFGARKADDTEARFANAAQDVIRGLQGMTRDLANLELRVFSLRKMDKARTKVVFHRNYTAQRLVDAAREWETGCANIPNIQIWGIHLTGVTTTPCGLTASAPEHA